MIKQRLISALAFILSLASFNNVGAANTTAAGSNSKFSVLDRVVASVNSQAITDSELNRQTQLLIVRLRQAETSLPPMPVLRKQLLERMILEKLQLQLAEAEGIKVDEESLEQALNEIAARDNLSLPQLQQFLEEQGVPFAHFRNTIKTEITLSKIQHKEIGQQITISKSDIDHFLNSPAGQDESEIEYHLGHILIALPESPSKDELQKTETRAQSIAKELKDGADFAKTAIAKSSDQQALNGGDLGWRKAASIPTSFVKVVPTLQIGEIYGPIRDNSGFHIIKLMGKRADDNSNKLKQEFKLRQILIKTSEKYSDAEAESILAKLREKTIEGANFATLAQKYSEESSSAAKGGDIGWISKDSVIPEFYQQITRLQNGEITQPFKTPLGWHLVLLVDKRNQTVSSEAVRNKAMEILYQRKFDELLIPWLRHLRSDAEVEIFLNEK